MAERTLAGAILTIDLDAVVANWRLLRDRVAPATCAAVVKADAYGLGVDHVAPALLRAGCRRFFVATGEEAIALRKLLVDASDQQTEESAWPVIAVLGGVLPGVEAMFIANDLVPVLNSLDDIAMWSAEAGKRGRPLPAIIHLDTGMSRLGLPPGEVDVLATELERLAGIELHAWMSHLACADEPEHSLNRQQLEEFEAALARLPPAPTSFANSSGIFLGRAWHGDVVRPGVALYGGHPHPGRIDSEPNPMAQVVHLEGRILQVREIDRHRTVGYGASHRADDRRRIATVAAGYADGLLRSMSNTGSGVLSGARVPIVGRVSMDLITVDVTDAPDAAVYPGAKVTLIGDDAPIDVVARDAGTIGYEVLTALGRRYHRVYLGGAAA